MSETFNVGPGADARNITRLEQIMNEAKRNSESPEPDKVTEPEPEPQAGGPAEGAAADADDESTMDAAPSFDEAETEAPDNEPLVVRVGGHLLQVHEPTWERLIDLADPMQRLFDSVQDSLGAEIDIRDVLSLAAKSWKQPTIYQEAAVAVAQCADIVLEKPMGWTASNAKASEVSMILIACLKVIPFDDLSQIAGLVGGGK